MMWTRQNPPERAFHDDQHYFRVQRIKPAAHLVDQTDGTNVITAHRAVLMSSDLVTQVHHGDEMRGSHEQWHGERWERSSFDNVFD